MPRVLPLISTVIGTMVLLGLGTWQMQRLSWKQALIAEREAGLAAPPTVLPDGDADWPSFAFRKVTVKGVFRHELEQVFGVKTNNNILGHDILTPLIRPDGKAILIDRGWVPADRVNPDSRPAGQLAGKVTVNGIARYRADDRPGLFTPENDPVTGYWYYYDLPAMEAALGLELAPLVVEADATPNPGGLPIGGRTEILLTNNHLQYAITWYGLAVALVAVYIVFHRQQAGSRTPSSET